MNPWIPQTQSSSVKNDSMLGLGDTSAGAPSPPRNMVTSRPSDEGIARQVYGISSLQPPNHADIASKTTKSPSGHGRSMSHPFPSLFLSKKKRDGYKTSTVLEPTDEAQPSPMVSSNGRPARDATRDLMAGRCMTCDSMVRWPKELVVFRCTVCMTINDLKPRVAGAASGMDNNSHGLMHSSVIQNAMSRKATSPLSNETTQALIEQSLFPYLLSRLCHRTEIKDRSVPSSPTGSSYINQHHCHQGLPESTSAHGNVLTKSTQISNQPLAATQAISDPSLSHGNNERSYSTSMPTNLKLKASYLSPSRYASPALLQRGSPGLLSPTSYGSNSQEERNTKPQRPYETSQNIFKPLEDYIIESLLSRESLNASFTTVRPKIPPRAASEGMNQPVYKISDNIQYANNGTLPAVDAKTLLIGDFAENGSWWAGGRSPKAPIPSRSSRKNISSRGPSLATENVNITSPRIDWVELSNWYRMVLHPGSDWRHHLMEMTRDDDCQRLSSQDLEEIENEILEAQSHTQRVLLKGTENLLKRPGAPLKEPDDIRFLLLILANPLLYPSQSSLTQKHYDSLSKWKGQRKDDSGLFQSLGATSIQTCFLRSANGPGHHSGIIKRILGLLSNLPNECHHHLVSWFTGYSGTHFQRTAELIGSFVTYRLTRQHGQNWASKHDPVPGLVPSIASSGQGRLAALQTVLGTPGQSVKQSDNRPKTVVYNDDWQVKAAARIMALLFSANNSESPRRIDRSSSRPSNSAENTYPAATERAHRQRPILNTSDFYNTLLDYSDLIADFEAWESRKGKFTFCQYPFFLSIWAKIQIMEYDARRQMEVRAREAFFDSIMTRKPVNQYLVLSIRRDCLVEDSLKGVSEVVGTGSEDIKKGLRIEFKGEEGIDAGGLRKEWFLLLVRDVFNPEHGMFTYDDDSRCCYFNPNSFETSDQFFLVGVVLGLAIYNSTILDVALPSFAFRKLLAAGPNAAPGAPSHAKPTMAYSLEDLAEFRPALAHGLQQLLDYDGDVEEIFCRDFVADVERYGQIIQVPLCQDGQSRPVTNSNRREFVDLYVRHLLDTAVSRQFEPFKRGFFRVCGGNALSLFRPEEIELLIRGSDDPLDITSLRAVSTCENWGVPNPAEIEPVIGWFWNSFEGAEPKDQRKLLSFITGSDRIPAMGAANLVIKVSCLGDDSMRFPVARTCFNTLSLWRYGSREKLEKLLWRAVNESEGFGLK